MEVDHEPTIDTERLLEQPEEVDFVSDLPEAASVESDYELDFIPPATIPVSSLD